MRGLPPLLALALAGGCAGDPGSFPSLAPRPVERLLAEGRPAAPTPPVADDSALAARIAALLGRARAGNAAFEAVIGSARRAVEGAGGAGSEGWTQAQIEITRAEATRAETASALAELDALGIERARQPTSDADMARVTAALADAQAIADRQHDQLESLKAALGPA